jgi:hypothetical protein
MTHSMNIHAARALRLTLIGAVVLAVVAAPASAGNEVRGQLVTLSDTADAPNGAWSWFSSQRAVIDTEAPGGPRLLVSSVSAGSGSENGDIDLHWYDLDTGSQGHFELHDQLEQDDHDSAALLVRPDGRYLAAYGRHGTDKLSRWRVSSDPHDPTRWGPEQTLSHSGSGRGLTYSNLHHLSEDRSGLGRTYNISRVNNFDPVVQVSTDQGSTFTVVGKLLTRGGPGDRPYLRYASTSKRLHFTVSQEHPRNEENNSIYHGYVEDGTLYNTYGQVIDSSVFDHDAKDPTQLTQVFAAGASFGGEPMKRAWTVDTEIDAQGMPVTVFQARVDDDENDHRFFYGRYDGTTWNVHQLAKAGGYLYNDEKDYTGLAAIDPDDPASVFISTKIDPTDGSQLSVYEIFKGVTDDGGASWEWSAITENSTMDNLRPLVPADGQSDRQTLVWLRGNYGTYTEWNTDVVATTIPEPATMSLLAIGGLGVLIRRRK